MTDKEIIIDGVNVAGCELFYGAYNENMCARVDGLTCGEDNNCHYKQLKRLEQENAELKAENAKYRQTLQEIKAIAEREYNKKLVEKDCFDCDASLFLIIDLITKAEEE